MWVCNSTVSMTIQDFWNSFTDKGCFASRVFSESRLFIFNSEYEKSNRNYPMILLNI